MLLTANCVCMCLFCRYNVALQYLNGLLAVEPSNKQVLELKNKLDKKLRDDALKGAAIGGGIAVGIVGALVGIGIALAKK